MITLYANTRYVHIIMLLKCVCGCGQDMLPVWVSSSGFPEATLTFARGLLSPPSPLVTSSRGSDAGGAASLAPGCTAGINLVSEVKDSSSAALRWLVIFLTARTQRCRRRAGPFSALQQGTSEYEEKRGEDVGGISSLGCRTVSRV
jgi:hypothetical protein